MWYFFWYVTGGLLWVVFPLRLLCFGIDRVAKRKPLRFGVRSLLIAVLYVAACFGWAAPERARCRAEEECIAKIARTLDSPVQYERSTGLFCPFWEFRFLDYVDLGNATIKDEQVDKLVVYLSQLPHLTVVTISANSISNEGLNRLREELPHALVSIGPVDASSDRNFVTVNP